MPRRPISRLEIHWVRSSRRVVSFLSLAGLLLATGPCAAQPPVSGRGPRGGGYLYVPVDPSGPPIGLPGFAPPPSPAVASPPSPPYAPGVPGAPSADTGSLLVEIEPATARVYVDGRPVAITQETGDRRARLVALAPGEHRVDAVHPGFAPLTIAVVIMPRQTFTLRSRLAREVGAPVLGSGYSVVPAP